MLALDTSTPAVTVAVCRLAEGGGVRTEAKVAVVDARRHGELLAPLVRDVLQQAGCVAGDLSAVAVGLGPGPFTGLRVGIVTAAALADALGIPAYGACSLDAVPRPTGTACLVATDARRREVYWAAYDESGARTDGPQVGAPAGLLDRYRGLPVTGPGALLYAAVLGDRLLDGEGHHPRAALLAGLVRDRAGRQEPGDPLTPLYLRRPDAVAAASYKAVTPR